MTRRITSVLVQRVILAGILLLPTFFYAIAQETGTVEEYSDENKEQTEPEQTQQEQSEYQQQEETEHIQQEENTTDTSEEQENSNNQENKESEESDNNFLSGNTQEGIIQDQQQSTTNSGVLTDSGSTVVESGTTNILSGSAEEEVTEPVTTGNITPTTGVVYSGDVIHTGTQSDNNSEKEIEITTEITNNESGTISPSGTSAGGSSSIPTEQQEQEETVKTADPSQNTSGDALIFSGRIQEEQREVSVTKEIIGSLPLPSPQQKESSDHSHFSAASVSLKTVSSICPRELYTELINKRTTINLAQQENYERKLARIASRYNCS